MEIERDTEEHRLLKIWKAVTESEWETESEHRYDTFRGWGLERESHTRWGGGGREGGGQVYACVSMCVCVGGGIICPFFSNY